jgi:hypothetical protein
MSRLWVDIERIVLDGVAIDPAKGPRIAALTQASLERLLRERGVTANVRVGAGTDQQKTQHRGATRSPPAADARWADELAQILYRAIDRSL